MFWEKLGFIFVAIYLMVTVVDGIVITPFRAIVKCLVEKNTNIENFTLLYGANKKYDFIFDEEFKKYEEKSDKFNYIKVVAFDDEYQCEKGFVTEVSKKIDLTDNKIYMCGPPPMTNAAKNYSCI